MATKTKSNTRGKSQNADHTAQGAKGNGTRSFDFSAFSQNFAKPDAFFNLGALQSFQPANFQQLMGQMVQTGQKNLEVLTACAQLYAERTKEMMEQHASLGSELLNETTATWQDSLNGKNSDPRVKLDGMTEFAKYCLEKSTTQARKAAEDNLQVCQQIGDQLGKRFSATVDELRSAA